MRVQCKLNERDNEDDNCNNERDISNVTICFLPSYDCICLDKV